MDILKFLLDFFFRWTSEMEIDNFHVFNLAFDTLYFFVCTGGKHDYTSELS